MHQIRPGTVTRVSIAYFPSRTHNGFADPRLSSRGYMFGMDVHVSIIPYSIKRKHEPDFGVVVDPDTVDTRSLISRIFSHGDIQPHPDVTGVVSEFIRSVAFQMAYEEVVYYEIAQVRFETKDQDGETGQNSSHLMWVPLHIPGRVVSIGNVALQMIPASERRERKKLFVAVPMSKVWKLTAPRELGGIREHRRLNRALILSSEPMPRYAWNRNILQEKELNLTEFLRQQHRLTASGSVSWGWPARGLWSGEALEYFSIYRHLRFAYAMAVLRESIVARMNELLVRTNVPIQLALRGLPTPQDMQNHIKDLAEGGLSFGDVLATIRA